MTPEGVSSAMMNQLASNMSSGIVNIRAEEYGGQPIEPIPAPLTASFRLGSGLFTSGERLITGEPDALVPAARAVQTYVPGFANVDRVLRMTTGERLFEELGLMED